MLNAKEVSDLVEQQILQIEDRRLVRRIRELTVSPYPVSRAWDYGAAGQQIICWTVLEHPASNTGIAFCPEGFGPSYPWGLVFLTERHMSIGMDSGWFISLEEAMRDSIAWDQSNPEGYESH